MNKGRLDRREFLKLEAAAMAAAAGGLPTPLAAQNLVTDRSVTELKWDKAPCRFCGTGCGVMVATKAGRVVATHGDMKAEVNRGLNCVKGYFLSKVMYGHDRITYPLLRKRGGRYDKNGEFTRVSWNEAFDVMAEKFKDALRRRGPAGVGMFGSGQWTVWEGYAANKLFKAGLRSNNIDPNARHCMASAVMGFMRTFGIDEPMGCYDDFEAADAFVLWGSNMAEMHPILWSRVTDRRLSAPHVRVAVLSTFVHRSFDLADIPLVFKPQTDLMLLNAIANHIITTGRVNKDFVGKHTVFKRGQTDIGYGLRPEHALEQKASGARARWEGAMAIDVEEPRPVIPALGPLYDHTRDLGWLLVRLTAGGFLLVHGLQKLMGQTVAGWAAQSLARRGIEPAIPLAYAVWFLETVGAVCIMLGLFTRLFAAMIFVQFLVIVFVAHWAAGFPWNRPTGGWEYPAFWGLIILAIFIRGGGPYSLDRKLGREL